MSSTAGESSLLLWVMAAAVAMLAAYLFVGWVRRAQSVQGWRGLAVPTLLAAMAMGLGMTSAMVLALSAEALSFPLGYRWLLVPALVFGPIVACLPMAWWLTRRQNWLALISCGLLLAAVSVTVQCGWILAAGLRPGVRWQPLLLGVSAGLQAAGFSAALWLAYSDSSSGGARKTLWRLGAAALMALAIIAGQEVVGSAATLSAQVGAIYLREAPATWLCLVAGAVVPTMLALMTLDLVLRNSGDRRRRGNHGGVQLNLPQRRKRRRKYRAL